MADFKIKGTDNSKGTSTYYIKKLPLIQGSLFKKKLQVMLNVILNDVISCG